MSDQKTLRDEIAIAAMKSILSSRQDYDEKGVAEYSYSLADAMMAERDVWIEWSGGKCPVSVEAIVEVRFRGDETDIDRADVYFWEHNGAPYDIISYRLVK